MKNRTTRLVPATLSIGLGFLLAAGCAVSGAATPDGVATNGATVGTASSTTANSGNDTGPTRSGTISSGSPGSDGSDGSAGESAEELDAVAITVHYAGMRPVVTSEFVRPMPNFVMTYGGRVVSSSPSGAVERSVSPTQVRGLLERAAGLGLLDGHGIPPGEQVPDGPFAKVTIVHQGKEVTLQTHSLLGRETDPRRKALHDFITDATNVESQARDEKPYRPVSYLFRATPVQQDAASVDAQPWPVEVVSPTEAADCAEITVVKWGGPMQTESPQWYVETGIAYQVAAIPALPGQAC